MILSRSTSSRHLIRRSLSPEKSNDLLLELPSKCRGLRPMCPHPFREASGGSHRKRTLSQLTKRVRCVGRRPGPSNPLKTLTAQISTGEKTSQRFRDRLSISHLSSFLAPKRYRSPCQLRILRKRRHSPSPDSTQLVQPLHKRASSSQYRLVSPKSMLDSSNPTRSSRRRMALGTSSVTRTSFVPLLLSCRNLTGLV